MNKMENVLISSIYGWTIVLKQTKIKQQLPKMMCKLETNRKKNNIEN